jgi:hypothetical protein
MRPRHKHSATPPAEPPRTPSPTLPRKGGREREAVPDRLMLGCPYPAAASRHPLSSPQRHPRLDRGSKRQPHARHRQRSTTHPPHGSSGQAGGRRAEGPQTRHTCGDAPYPPLSVILGLDPRIHMASRPGDASCGAAAHPPPQPSPARGEREAVRHRPMPGRPYPAAATRRPLSSPRRHPRLDRGSRRRQPHARRHRRSPTRPPRGSPGSSRGTSGGGAAAG